MIDLHCHLLPGIDDGPQNLDVSLAMAQEFARDGVTIVACTPHILPGLYQNSGPQIRQATEALQSAIFDQGIDLRLVAGADNHVVPDFVTGLRSGHLLTLGDTRYVLVEPPHHVLPARLEELFFSILTSGFVPILTHPERLSWIRDNYALILRLVDRGVWMQVTAGSLAGRFGKDAKYWAERMLGDGAVHILATDAHDLHKRPPELAKGRILAARLVGEVEAARLVCERPEAALSNCVPSEIAPPLRGRNTNAYDEVGTLGVDSARLRRSGGGIVGRLRRLFN
jgi:protein-tyrosine phosphatase